MKEIADVEWRELGEKSIKVFLRLIKPNEVTQMMDKIKIFIESFDLAKLNRTLVKY